MFVWDPIERWELGDPDPGPEWSPSADRAKLVQAMALRGWTEVALHRGDSDSRIEFVRPLMPDPAGVLSESGLVTP